MYMIMTYYIRVFITMHKCINNDNVMNSSASNIYYKIINY